MKMTYISPIQSSHQGVYYPWPKCIWDEAIFKFGWGGGEVESTQTGFSLFLNWDKEVVFYLKFEFTIFN